MARAHLRWWVLSAALTAIWILFLSANNLGLPKNEIQENRVLAKFPEQSPRSLSELKAYREGVDAFVADQFPARTRLIGALNYLRYRLGYSGTPHVLIGRKHWLFYDDGGHLRQLRHGDALSAADADAWAGTLAGRTAKLQSEGIRYLFVAPPVKEQVYPELAPRFARGSDGGSDGDDLRQAAARAGVAQNLLWLREEMVAARKQHPDVYSPYDTHWTGYGAHAAYVALVRRFTELGLPVGEPKPLSAFTRRQRPQLQQPQDLAYMLGIATYVNQDFPEFEDVAVESAARTEYLTERRDWTGDRIIDTGAIGKPVLQWAGDSFSNELLPYLYPHFSRIIASHHEQGWFREDLTAKYHPDVVVLEVLAAGMRHAMNPALPRPATMPPALAPRAAEAAPTMAATAGAGANAFAAAALPREGASVVYTHRCNLEALTLAGGKVSASGWMADIDGNRSGTSVRLLLASPRASFSIEAPIASERPDVASYFSKPGVAHSGFGFEAPASLPAGDYEAYLLQDVGARTLVCGTGRTLPVPGGAR
jgi:hypothetical protein